MKLGDNRTALSQILINGLGQENTRTIASTTGYFCERSIYNVKGQLVRQYRDTGSRTTPTAPTLYEYDSFGNMVKQTLALTGTPTVANSPIIERAYTVESIPEGVYQVTTQTRYNAEGEPLTAIQKQLISQSCPHLESKTISVNERGLTSTQWTEYADAAKRMVRSSIPTSDTVAEAMTVDGFTLRQTDHTSVTQRFSRTYRADGMVLVATDGRGNSTTTQTDLLGRTVRVTDATGATTTTSYDPASGQPDVITDARGYTSCYRYDQRGRKVAEWGTGIQPACFEYDEANHMAALTTFRASEADITTDPGNRTDGDTTRWTYHDAAGLEIRKTYADGSHVDKSYDAYNRLSVKTLARGITKSYTYEHNRGLLLGVTYSDGTTARSYQYNQLGQLVQVSDDAGTRTLGYNEYGEQQTDSLLANGVTHLITESRDGYGRSTGYTYAKNGAVQQTVTTGYGTDGRIATAGFLHGGVEKQFSYSYLTGSDLLQTLAMPNNMTLTQSYETQRDLLTGMYYKRGTTGVVEREYSYDTLGRPTARNTSRQGMTKNDTFAYNTRSELVAATVNGTTFSYDYDDIGNRKSAQEAAEETTAYTVNALNQYTAIDDFAPTYDLDGNQTLVQTSTGIWAVEYNAENRPVLFTRTEADGTETQISCTYDTMGRRATKQVRKNGSVTLNQRYLYQGYLQIAACDQTRSGHPCLWLILWDPTQPVNTRPLSIQKDGTWYCYGWDLTKNICEVFGSNGYIRTAYTYTPYGAVTADGNVSQPLQWSSEFFDSEQKLVYYNFRYYNPQDGRWLTNDPHPAQDWNNLYLFVENNPSAATDNLGLLCLQKQDPGMKKVIKQGGAGLLVSLDYGFSSDYKLCCVSCSNGSPGIEATGGINFSISLMAEMATYSFYAKKSVNFSKFTASIEGRFWGGVRVYGSISAGTYLEFTYSSCKFNDLRINGGIRVKGSLGLEIGGEAYVKGTVRYNQAVLGLIIKKSIKLGVGFALGGRLNLEWDPKISCNSTGCSLSGPIKSSIEGTARFLILGFETEYSLSQEMGEIGNFNIFIPNMIPSIE